MTQSFVNGSGLPGQAFLNSSPIWVAGAERLMNSTCERVRQGQVFGLQTLVCIPSANGVVELGSTELISQSSDLMNKVRILFNFNNVMDVGSWMNTNHDQGENDPSSLWMNDPSNGIEIKENNGIASGSGLISSNSNVTQLQMKGRRKGKGQRKGKGGLARMKEMEVRRGKNVISQSSRHVALTCLPPAQRLWDLLVQS